VVDRGGVVQDPITLLAPAPPQVPVMVDEAGTILSVNPFGADQLGYSVNELIGRSVLMAIREKALGTTHQMLYFTPTLGSRPWNGAYLSTK
jgi:PAS domain S-box-containing protein